MIRSLEGHRGADGGSQEESAARGIEAVGVSNKVVP
jgi:hypothetical protein